MCMCTCSALKFPDFANAMTSPDRKRGSCVLGVGVWDAVVSFFATGCFFGLACWEIFYCECRNIAWQVCVTLRGEALFFFLVVFFLRGVAVEFVCFLPASAAFTSSSFTFSKRAALDKGTTLLRRARFLRGEADVSRAGFLSAHKHNAQTLYVNINLPIVLI